MLTISQCLLRSGVKICRNSQQKLVDPIWQTLQDCNCFTVVVSPYFEQAEHNGHMQGEAKALQVPFYYIDRVFPQAFSHVANVRRVQVDAGYRIIGEGAWRNCQHLQIVHLDSTVTSLQTQAFHRCYALRKVIAPGCKQFGAQVFEECCALLQIGTAECCALEQVGVHSASLQTDMTSPSL